MDSNKVCDPLGGDGVRCIPGCYPHGEQCAEMHRDWLCSWPPSQLRDALEAQRMRPGGLNKNNEMVVDTRSVVNGLPASIEAFFITRGSSALEYNKVLRAHEAFLREYPSIPASMQPPLLELDLRDGGKTPFTWREPGRGGG